MRRRARPIVVVLALAVAGAGPPDAAVSTGRGARTVVAVFWGPEDFPATPAVNAAIREVLAARSSFPVDYFSEYLETDLFDSDAASQALREYMRLKYRGRRVDLVIAIADPALRFVVDCRDELFPEAPIVYSGVAVPPNVATAVGGALTGVLRGSAYDETLKMALQLHPSTERVFVVANGLDRQTVEIARTELAEFSPGVDLSYVEATRVDDLLAQIKAVPERSLVLYIWHSEDEPLLYADQVAEMVAAASPVPVYGTNDRYIGRGVVGGVVRGTIATGTRLGEMALQILDGAPPAEIAIENAHLVPTFDWRELQHWKINPSALPAGSIVLFEVPSAWDTYRPYIIVVALVIAAQLSAIAGLLTQRAKRRHAERAVRASEAALRSSYQRIRQLARGLIKAQEVTRANVARDLHDGVCQDLVGVSVSISTLKRSSGRLRDPSMQEALATLERSVLATAEGARRLSHELHPATLRLLRLAAATRAHCLEVEKRHDVQVSFTAKGDFLDVDPDVALCVFRVAQEALRNAAVHGDARRLDVTLVRSTEHIELTVTDDGRGFDVSDVRGDDTGLGLVSMEERAQAAGGSLEITTRPGAGTCVVLRVPNLSAAMDDQDAPDPPGEPHCARESTS